MCQRKVLADLVSVASVRSASDVGWEEAAMSGRPGKQWDGYGLAHVLEAGQTQDMNESAVAVLREQATQS